MAARKLNKSSIPDATLMFLIMWVVEILITTFIIQYAWNFVLAGDNNPEGPAIAEGAVKPITFWDAFLLSVSVKVLLFGMSGLQEML